MKQFFVDIVKHSSFIYSVYHAIGDRAVSILKRFVAPDDRMILFVSFGGKKFDDSPRAIYEQMIGDARFQGFRFVWAFRNPGLFDVPEATKVRIDSFAYYKAALKARVWVTNNSVTRGLTFKGKNTFYYNSWHGSAIKKIGADIPQSTKSFKEKGGAMIDVMAAQSQYDVDVFSRVFNMDKGYFRLTGLPRNDSLARYTQAEYSTLRKKLKIEEGKKVILYAPTYREFDYDASGVLLELPIDFGLWEKSIGDRYILLFRAHHAVSNAMNVRDNTFVRNVSDYPSLSDLMIASDMLISDYSSIFFDYSIMGKPMLGFTYDYDRYEKERGMYFDIRTYLSCANDETELLEMLRNLDYASEQLKAVAFRDKYVTEYGRATEQSVDIIANELKLN